jgi:PKD repeat protein
MPWSALMTPGARGRGRVFSPLRRGSLLALWLLLGGPLACGGAAGGPAGPGGGEPDGSGPVARLELEARDLTVSVDDAGSTAPGGGPLTYAWDFGDGATATVRTPPPHTYAGAGTYVVSLSVSDGTAAAAAQRTIDVAPRTPGDYAPDSGTTGVPAVVADRLHLLDLELPGKSASRAPTVEEETLRVERSGGAYVLTRNGAPISLPPGNAYVEGGRFVLDLVRLRGYLDVRAPDVTVRRSVIEGVRIPDAPEGAPPGGVNAGRRLVRGNNAATTGLLLEDVELRVPPEVQRGPGVNASHHHGLGLEASRLTLLRAEVVGTVDGMQIHQGSGTYTDVRIAQSWIHGMQFHPLDADRTDGDPTHSDGIQVECSLPQTGAAFGVRLLGNTIDLTNHPDLNAAVMVTRNACGTSGLLIEGNFLDGTPLPINVGTGLADRPITLYANRNRFGPNRATGAWPGRTASSTFTAKVIAAKANADGGAAWENYDPARTQAWVYFSFDPPAAAGGAPPAGEANQNVMVDHAPGAEVWGTTPRGAAGVGLY